MTATFALDILLCMGMIGFALATLFSEAEPDSVAAFIGLGTLAAVAWARLGAPDVAMAEAAIGAGLTGALLFRHLTFGRDP